MTFKPSIWYPIAVVASVINLVSIAFATGQSPPMHAMTHAGLAVAFGLWAQRLRHVRWQNAIDAPSAPPEVLEGLEDEVSLLREELSEMQERLDFTERLLAQHPERGRAGPSPARGSDRVSDA